MAELCTENKSYRTYPFEDEDPPVSGRNVPEENKERRDRSVPKKGDYFLKNFKLYLKLYSVGSFNDIYPFTICIVIVVTKYSIIDHNVSINGQKLCLCNFLLISVGFLLLMNKYLMQHTQNM